MGVPSWSTIAVLALAATLCSGVPDDSRNSAVGATDTNAPGERVGASPGSVEGYEVVATYPHDTAAYTQGLFWRDGYLYEGTGRYGTSWLRKVDPTDGNVLQQASLPSSYFGEGIALLGSRIFQLTWLSNRGFIYDADRLEVVGEFAYETEGWGLTSDGVQLIMSDGSADLLFLDADDQQVIRTLRVRENGEDLRGLNELEYIGGLVYANVWHSDIVYQIDPVSGEVVGTIDFSDLLAGERPRDSEAVLIGIAYNPNNGHLFVTGKNWPKLFEVRLTPPN